MAQLNEIIAWKCLKCGRVLTTEKGKKRHLETCKYIPPVSDNQITCDDMRNSSKDNAAVQGFGVSEWTTVKR